MARLFFALWPDANTRIELYDIATQFSDAPVRLVKKSNLHMTLEFLGNTSDEDKQGLVELVSKISNPSFDLELTRVGWWKQPQILFIGTAVVPPELQQLVQSLRKCVQQQGLLADKREYKPHVTIARKAKQVVVPKETFSIHWHADSFALVLSEPGEGGVHYRVLLSWSLS